MHKVPHPFSGCAPIFTLLIEQKNELSMLIENPETYIPDVELLIGVLTLLDAVHDFAKAHQNIR